MSTNSIIRVGALGEIRTLKPSLGAGFLNQCVYRSTTNAYLSLIHISEPEPTRPLQAGDFKSPMCYQFHHQGITLFWCIRRDLNSQSFRHWLLRPTCIPIPPLMHNFYLFILISWYQQWDSNPQAYYRREILSLLCIPFHHAGILFYR